MMGVALLSTGSMGSALAQALLAGGARVSVWNRTAEKAQRLASHGATVAASVVEAVASAQLVVAVPHPFGALEDYLLTPAVAGQLRGKDLVVMSSCESLEQPGRVLAWARDAGATYLDAKIFGYPRDIGREATPLAFCGDAGAFARLAPTMAVLGKPVYLGEPITHAAVLEAACTSWYLSTCFGLMNGLALCKAAGLPLTRFAETCFSLVPGMKGYVALALERMVPTGDYDPGRHGTASMAGLAGVLEHFTGVFRAFGVNPALSEAAIAGMAGGLDMAALIDSLGAR